MYPWNDYIKETIIEKNTKYINKNIFNAEKIKLIKENILLKKKILDLQWKNKRILKKKRRPIVYK
jgi:hypothetical protein